MKRALAAPILAAAVLAAGCGSGPRVTQSRDLGAFSRVEVEGSVNLTVTRGPRTEALVTSGEEVIDRVRTDVRGGVLMVSARRRGIVIGPDGFGGTRVRVTAPRIDGLVLEGSSDVEVLDLRTGALDVSIHGSGNVTVTGRARRLRAEIRGSGDADLASVATRDAAVSIRGPGDVRVGRARSLDVSIHGPGDVSYRGRPRLTTEVRGPGNVGRDP